jgi:hypothetical protein
VLITADGNSETAGVTLLKAEHFADSAQIGVARRYYRPNNNHKFDVCSRRDCSLCPEQNSMRTDVLRDCGDFEWDAAT